MIFMRFTLLLHETEICFSLPLSHMPLKGGVPSLFTPGPANGHLGWLHFGVSMCKGAVNTLLQGTFTLCANTCSVSPGQTPARGIAEVRGQSIFGFMQTAQVFPK